MLALFCLGIDTPQALANAKKTPQTSLPSPYDVIALVNQLRAANGLPAYNTNGALMASAQAHSDYQASTGSITHTGSGGSTPKSRAAAAGYGGGATIYISENIYGGSNASANQAVTWWQGDSLHLNTMLGASYVDAGAGVASDGSVVYFTLDVGYISGSPGSGAATASGAQAAPVTQVAFYPLVVATPLPDGSIIHVVQAGQALWNIAAAYKINLADLLTLNGFSSNPIIHPGDKILIKTADANATVEATTTSTATSETPKSSTPTIAATKRSMATAVQGDAPGRANAPAAPAKTDPILIAIAVLVSGGTLLVIVGNLLKRGK
jgi:LysM repeat protein